MKIHLVTFMTDSKFGKENYYVKSVRKLFDSAKQFGVEHFHLYTPDLLPVSSDELDYMKSKSDQGFGYYSWKPIVILDVLQKISDDDVVIYHDAGRTEYNYEFRKDFRYLVNEIIEEFNGIGIPVGPFKHKQYCKRECFVHMNCNEDKYWNLNQVSANWSIWKKSDLSVEIVTKWKEYCLDPRGIINTESINNEPLSDFSDYIEHRWDQAILTNLVNNYLYNGYKIGLITAIGWEKDINNFVKLPQSQNKDYSFIKTPHIVNRNDITLIIDVFYSKNKLTVLTTGAVNYVLLNKDGKKIPPNSYIEDPHKNVHCFQFDVSYSARVKLEIMGYDSFIDSSDMVFEVEKDYYGDTKFNHILTAICHTDINSLSSIVTFVKYHLRLGIDKIVLHENGGSKVYELYDALRTYIEDGRVMLFTWPMKFYQVLRKEIIGHPTNVGEVSHMNHSLHLFSDSTYLTGLNIDELLVPPKDVLNLNKYLDELVEKLNLQDSGGISIMPTDFRSKSDDTQYYKSTEVIDNVNKGPKIIYFIKNIKMTSCHVITLGKNPISVDKEVLSFNHYPSLDSHRMFDNVIGYMQNLNYSLFEE